MSGWRFTAARRERPMEGLSTCGDRVVDVQADDWRLFAVIDALGHGPDAQRSAQAVAEALAQAGGEPLSRVFERAHVALRGLRGVVMSAVLVQGREVSFAGVGNVEIFAPEGATRPVAFAGTLGSGAYRFRPFSLQLARGQRWVLASDGIKVREASALLPKLKHESPEAAADALLSQATRPHDDASVLVLDIEDTPPEGAAVP